MGSIKTRAIELLRSGVNNPNAEFKEDQWESISTLVEKRSRLLVIQRTGWGKSSVYFVSTKLMREQGYGPTIIISPLLALMRNQVESAAKYGVKLGSINSSNSKAQNDSASREMLAGKLDAIIISPEQLSKDSFVEDVLRPIADTVGLFVIDEAHCISDWGHDFRPDYKRIGNLLPSLPDNMPVLATTATANTRVMNDVQHQLGDNIQVFRGALTRDSLYLQNIYLPKRSERLAWLADTLPTIRGTGIIYTATTRDAEQVTAWLKSRDIAVEAYYGTLKGLSGAANTERRIELEELLMTNQLKALVATSALGMGYDKPDVGFVIHYQCPGSVVAYYQQVGRAGRGIPQARGILLSGDEDDDIQRYFIDQAFPQEGLVNDLLQRLDDAGEGLTKPQLLMNVNAADKKIDAALRFLMAESPAPVIISERSPVTYSRTINSYTLPHETIARLSEIKANEWDLMLEYTRYQGCLMQYLARELDDPMPAGCGRCANCSPETAKDIGYCNETGQAAAEFLTNDKIEIEPKKRVVEADFPVYQFPMILSKAGLAAEPGRALCRWGEAGWGKIAKAEKSNGAFSSKIVAASAKLINEQWNFDSPPKWATYVPSLRNPSLVAVFAETLAAELGIPCDDIVSKKVDNKPQKTMQNTRFRCANLDDTFSLGSVRQGEPVLLIDDAVDSRWTFTVIAALLKRAGSGPVYPFAVLSTANS